MAWLFIYLDLFPGAPISCTNEMIKAEQWIDKTPVFPDQIHRFQSQVADSN